MSEYGAFVRRLEVSRVLGSLLVTALMELAVTDARAEGENCPTPKDEIATDRPDVTNSSLYPSVAFKAKTESMPTRETVVGRLMAQTPDGGWGLLSAWRFSSIFPPTSQISKPRERQVGQMLPRP